MIKNRVLVNLGLNFCKELPLGAVVCFYIRGGGGGGAGWITGIMFWLPNWWACNAYFIKMHINHNPPI